MKAFVKGGILGVVLVAANNLCSYILSGTDLLFCMWISGIVFGIIICGFLISNSLPELLNIGFTGLFTMFFV
jgi:hypothetical protein